MANKQMDGFLDEEVGGAPPEVEAVAPTPEAPPEPPPAPEPEAKAPETPAPEAQDEVPVADANGMVPRSVVISVRNDWKGKAERFQGENTALKSRVEELERRVSAPPPPAPPPQPTERQPFRPAPNPSEDPAAHAQWLEEKLANDRANVSEAVLRAEIGDDAEINSKIQLFQQAAAANPRLLMALRVHPDPYRWAFEQGQKVEAQRAEQARNAEVLKQLGSDPQAWLTQERERMRTELEAELANRPMGAAPVHLPQSLGTARSAAPRQSVAVAEEIPFDGMFGQRKKRSA